MNQGDTDKQNQSNHSHTTKSRTCGKRTSINMPKAQSDSDNGTRTTMTATKQRQRRRTMTAMTATTATNPPTNLLQPSENNDNLDIRTDNSKTAQRKQVSRATNQPPHGEGIPATNARTGQSTEPLQRGKQRVRTANNKRKRSEPTTNHNAHQHARRTNRLRYRDEAATGNNKRQTTTHKSTPPLQSNSEIARQAILYQTHN